MGGFVHLSRGTQQAEEPLQGPFGLLHARLFSNKHSYSSPKAKMKTKNIESPVFAGDVLSSSECLRTGEEMRWAVEVQSEWTSGFDDIVVGRLGEGCIGRRRASTESPVSPVDFLPATATGSPETPQAPAMTTGLAPGGCTGLITTAPAATASPPQQHRPDHMALHCVSERWHTSHPGARGWAPTRPWGIGSGSWLRCTHYSAAPSTPTQRGYHQDQGLEGSRGVGGRLRVSLRGKGYGGTRGGASPTEVPETKARLESSTERGLYICVGLVQCILH